MPRTFEVVSRASFLADYHSVVRDNGGRQIDWAAVTAAYVDSATGKKTIRAGTVMSELASGKLVPRAIAPVVAPATTPVPASCILATSAQEGAVQDALTGYGVLIGAAVNENLLPDATGTPKVLPAAYKTELNAANVGTGFAFRQYEDNRYL